MRRGKKDSGERSGKRTRLALSDAEKGMYLQSSAVVVASVEDLETSLEASSVDVGSGVSEVMVKERGIEREEAINSKKTGW